MEPRQFLGLDIGAKKTGLARGSILARIAEPLASVDTESINSSLNDLIEKYAVDGLVVGLPRNLSGEDTEQTRWVRHWVEQAKNKINLPFYWQDEALTTKIAEAKSKSHKHPVDSHSLAAAILLQDFLDTPQASRVIC